jgi:hypothetical protein
MPDRRRSTLDLTETARRGLDRFCTDQRVTLTALVEAIGLELDDGRAVIPDRVVERAGEIDRNRRSRR